MVAKESKGYEDWVDMMHEDAVTTFENTDKHMEFFYRWEPFEQKLMQNTLSNEPPELVVEYLLAKIKMKCHESEFVYQKGIRDCSKLLRRFGVLDWE